MTANNNAGGAAKEAPKKPKTPTAKKRDLQNEKRKEQNKSFKSKVRTAIRSLENSLNKKEKKDAVSPKLNQVYSLIDKGVKKGIYKPNKAARVKSRYTARTKTA